MFKLWTGEEIGRVSPFNGCHFGCYDKGCWACRMAKRLKAKRVKGYENGFEPSFIPERMKVPNKDVVWIGSMGDFAFQPTRVMKKIIKEMIGPNPDTLFFLETKRPEAYKIILDLLPENVMISTTIETNRNDLPKMGKAPAPKVRWQNFRDLDWDKKHISIEPIMRFDIEILVGWMRKLNPEIVSVGYDNYNCGLEEPPIKKTLELIDRLEEFTEVERKTIPGR